MNDVVDRANNEALFINDLAIQQHLIGRALPPQQIIDGAVECLDCGIEIPDDRLDALPNCVRCIECQTAHEIRQKQ